MVYVVLCGCLGVCVGRGCIYYDGCVVSYLLVCFDVCFLFRFCFGGFDWFIVW